MPKAYKPSKTHLLLLDAIILFLQMLLTTIAYEVSLFSKSPSDISLTPQIPMLSSPFPSPSPDLESQTLPMDDPSKSSLPPLIIDSPYIIDLRLAHVFDRLRNPAPSVSDSNLNNLLPFPNTTPWPLPASLRMLIRARAEVRRRAQAQTLTLGGPANVENGVWLHVYKKYNWYRTVSEAEDAGLDHHLRFIYQPSQQPVKWNKSSHKPLHVDTGRTLWILLGTRLFWHPDMQPKYTARMRMPVWHMWCLSGEPSDVRVLSLLEQRWLRSLLWDERMNNYYFELTLSCSHEPTFV